MHIISITTRCTSVEGFLDLFHRYIDPEDQALFIASPDPREVGQKAPFQIRLRDGTIVMRGHAEVVRRWTDEESPWARPGYCIKLSDLESDAQKVYDDLVAGSKSVAPAARRMVPPVVAPQPKQPDPEPAAEPAKTSEKSFPLDLAALGATTPPPAIDPDAAPDPLWGGLPPPPPPRPRVVEILRGSRRLQIAAGTLGGAVLGALLAVVTHGSGAGGESVFVLPSGEPLVASEAPAPPASSPEPAAPEPAAPEPAPADPEPAPAIDEPEAPRARKTVVLDLRSEPPGAIFFVDGKNVGKAPVKVKVKAGKRVKLSARLKGFREWKDRVRARDDRRVTARLR